MEKDEILQKLADPQLPFMNRLKLAAKLELDLWEDRDPPNLGENEFKKLLARIPSDVQVSWSLRESISGRHGETGEDEVFKFEFKTVMLGHEHRYFVKGYFFDKGACKGVCIQSFRLVDKKPVTKMRLVRVK